MNRDACRNIAWTVPASNSRCLGTVNVWLLPAGDLLLSFTWLPRCEWTWNPKRTRIETTSSPDKRLGLGIYEFDFEGQQNSWVGSQSEVRKVFSFQMERNRFLEIGYRFV